MQASGGTTGLHAECQTLRSELRCQGALHVDRGPLDVIGEEAHAEQARQTGAGTLVAAQAGEVAHRVQRCAVPTSHAHRLMHDVERRSLVVDRKVDSHAC